MRRGSAPWPSWSRLQLAQQDWASSAEIPELVQWPGRAGNLRCATGLPAPLGGEAESVSSPLAAAEQRPAGFWFNINAELVIYGATEPGRERDHRRPADLSSVPMAPSVAAARCRMASTRVTVSAMSAAR